MNYFSLTDLIKLHVQIFYKHGFTALTFFFAMLLGFILVTIAAFLYFCVYKRRKRSPISPSQKDVSIKTKHVKYWGELLSRYTRLMLIFDVSTAYKLFLSRQAWDFSVKILISVFFASDEKCCRWNFSHLWLYFKFW